MLLVLGQAVKVNTYMTNFEIKCGDMTEELGERLDIANAKMTEMTQKQDVMIEKLDNNTYILKGNTSILTVQKKIKN